MNRLLKLLEKPSLLVIGLMSGTSPTAWTPRSRALRALAHARA